MLAFGYLLGSVSAAIMISKFTKVSDPRDVGSGNPGTTNILRYAGKKIAAFTLLGDILKGYLPVKLSLLIGFTVEQSAAIALMTFLGHLYPIFHGFKGGKGVATFIGVTAALFWQISLIFGVIWLSIAKITKYSSVSALASSLGILFLITIYFDSKTVTVCYLIMVALIYLRHHENIRNLLNKTEKRIGQ